MIHWRIGQYTVILGLENLTKILVGKFNVINEALDHIAEITHLIFFWACEPNYIFNKKLLDLYEKCLGATL